MDDERFWTLVGEAREHAPTVDGRAAWLVASLVRFGERDTERFGHCFDRAMARAYRWDLWGVATLVHQGHEDEERFADFRAWLVSLGRDAFEAALDDPDTLAEHLVVEKPEARAFLRVARTAYEKLTGNELPMTTMDLFASPTGAPIPASDLATRFPRVAALR
ncbi:MAG: DUF4240 domain-containing protein [Sandaracinus sp.]|nr:DUF4240 domain-containing protein [Sandaracinus sp.]MCB9620621.1 DUF4240 domain-containing protein [Sandaracinus sp.]MCB9632362.1 DUF4240 domain-containing protein [Sandaracinus sp.]